MQIKMVILGVFLGLSLLILIIFSCLSKWNEIRYRKKSLPPGTMGWPLYGETTEFLTQGPSFMKNKRSRYGNFFKTHISGSPTIVSMDPEMNRYILNNEGKVLIPGYPKSMMDLLGRCNIAVVSGSLHKAMRGTTLGLISPTMLREQLLAKIDLFMSSQLSDLDGKVIDIQDCTTEMWLLTALILIAGINETSKFFEALKSEFNKLLTGLFSQPIYLPGTDYYQGWQARRKIISILGEIIGERRGSMKSNDDILDSLLFGMREDLNDEQLLDLIITLIYSGFETVSTTSMMAIKYLHEHPAVLEELMNEHMEIRRRKLPDVAIDWNDYKSMTFTRSVILETSRLATNVNGIMRKTTQDMELKGYFIPKGWKIYVYTREINYDPFLYPEPSTFNPWRWLGKNLESNPLFLSFGGGSRLCPGKELAITQISMFLHYFVTRYRWEEVGGEKLLMFPRIEAPSGLHIRVFDR